MKERQSQPAGARAAAIEALCRWQGSGRPVDEFLEPLSAALSPRDRQLARQIVYGILRNLRYLDLVIGRTASHPLRRMKPRTLAALRVGAFQLLFLDRVPPSAAVNETVQALKAVRQPKWLLRFVNGVLRAMARARDTLPSPDTLPAGDLTLLNHPDWLVERWRHRWGQRATEVICGLNNTPPHLTLRVNTRRTTRDDLLTLLRGAGHTAQPATHAPDAIVLRSFSGPVTGLPGYGEGLFLVQDQAAQLACLLLGPLRPGQRYLDGCAGLGGKTASLALPAPAEARITAVEPDRRRFGLLAENMTRLELLPQVRTFRGTLARFAATDPGSFAGIFIDAPCSGTGVIRRHPDIRWNRREEDLARYRQRQLDLLDTAAGLLAADGVLVYATCSLEPEENHQVIERFLADHLGFIVDDARGLLPGPAASLVDDAGFFHPLPADAMDGFFAARLIRDPVSAQGHRIFARSRLSA